MADTFGNRKRFYACTAVECITVYVCDTARKCDVGQIVTIVKCPYSDMSNTVGNTDALIVSPQPASVSHNRNRFIAERSHLASAGEDSGGTGSVTIPDEYVLDSDFTRTITLNEGNSWQESLQTLQMDSRGNVYYYRIEETSVPEGYQVRYTNQTVRGDADATITLTAYNTYEKGRIKVVKEVQDNGGQRIDTDKSYSFTIRNTATNEETTLTVSANGEGTVSDWLPSPRKATIMC